MSDLRDRLRQLRKENKFTQKDIANYLGITESAYGYYEQGRNEPSIENLNKLAAKYNVNVGYLTGKTDDPTPATSEDEIEQLINDPELNLFFKDFKSAPDDIRKQTIDFMKFLLRDQANRKPGDKQGE